MQTSIGTRTGPVKGLAADVISGADVASSREGARTAPQVDGSLARGRTRVERRDALKRAAEAARRRPAGQCSCILDCAWFKSDQGCKRTLPRRPEVLLTEAERVQLRGMLARADQCGTRFVSLRRVGYLNSKLTESRMIVQAPCGMRVCPQCDKRMRSRHAKRAEGLWSQFTTLGVPHAYGSVREAWLKIGDDVGKLFHALRRSYREEPGLHVRVSKAGLRDVDRRNATRESWRRKLPDLQYSWCIEPHESGYPHVHFVSNTAYIDFAWLRVLWSEITGCAIRWHDTERVYSQDGICRYLSKYIAKCKFPPDLSVLMFGRRLHASSLPKDWVPPDGWSVEHKQDQNFLRSLTNDPTGTAAAMGFEVKLRSPGRYAVMERPLEGDIDWSRFEESATRIISTGYEGSWFCLLDQVASLWGRLSGRWQDYCYHKRRAKIRLTPVDKQKPGT